MNDNATIDVLASVAGPEFDVAVERFRAAGFALRMTMPADDPACALLEGDRLTIRLVRDGAEWPSSPLSSPLVPTFELTRLADTGWGTGRAGMHYRDLLPSRQGGRFIASHIRIPDAGPVPDDVHYHHVEFQLIFCVAGWVRLVYQGQGDPFDLGAGDCVLQPPTIRHRVLESSAGLEVVELTCPAVHETWFDSELSLPTPDRQHEFGGQPFVLHRAAEATWEPWRADGFECRDTGIGAATDGLVGARVVRGELGSQTPVAHDSELQFWFVLDGAAILVRPDKSPETLGRGDAVAVPAAMAHALVAGDRGVELLEVTAPAAEPRPAAEILRRGLTVSTNACTIRTSVRGSAGDQE
jgi:mannose-6-phosphate isomerase-like protein (cupin superfamily)